MRLVSEGGEIMLRWALIFLIIALVAALFGFTGIAVAAAGIAKFLFFLFLVICLVFFIMGISAGRRVPYDDLTISMALLKRSGQKVANRAVKRPCSRFSAGVY